MASRFDVDIDEAIESVAILQEVAEMEDQELSVLDVGGAQRPLVFATHMIDILSYEERNTSNYIPEEAMRGAERFNINTWTKQDICITPWPYEDNQFDYVWCTHVLQSVRDPIAVLKEISRVGKTGFIQVIDRNYECLYNIDSDRFTGYYDHRWLVEDMVELGALLFTHKSPFLITDLHYIPKQSGRKHINVYWREEVFGFENIIVTDVQVKDNLVMYAHPEGDEDE